MTPGRVLALDPGTRRVGVAVSDPLGITAQPHSVLDAEDPDLMGQIARLGADLGVERIVVGLPVSLNGTEGPAAATARTFAAAVAGATGLPVDLADERFTSVSAERVLVEAGLSGRRRRAVRDRVAAAVLLQSYLDGGR
ncbi:MAG: Holliday junction resolvase RuvX [Acidimicrobiia bacterium]|jgi:putative Holliday junction resolvase|nr:Holliday junction resolvase RuvX [Acidimicrobiia bacterium]